MSSDAPDEKQERPAEPRTAWLGERVAAAQVLGERGLDWGVERVRGFACGLEAFDLERRGGGTLLAGGLAYRLFFWLLPLGLTIAALLSFWQEADPDGIDEAARELGMGAAAARSASEAIADSTSSRWYFLLAGLWFTGYFSLGVVRALRLSHALAWGVPLEKPRRPLAAVALFNGVALGLMGSGTVATWLRAESDVVGLVVTLGMFLVYGVVALAVMRLLPHGDASDAGARARRDPRRNRNAGDPPPGHPLPRTEARPLVRALRLARRRDGDPALALLHRPSDRRLGLPQRHGVAPPQRRARATAADPRREAGIVDTVCSAVSSSTPHRAPTWRLIVARVLVVLGVLLAVVTIVAGYLRFQAFDSETFEETATELIANDAIRAEVATTAVDALFTNVDVAAELENRLPPDQQGLAGPISAGLRELTDRAANRLLERPRVQALWRESVSLAHDELVDVLRNETTVVRVEDQAVVLNLRPVVLRLGERLAFVGNIADRLPPDAGAITILPAEKLDRAQRLTELFETVATWIWVFPFLLWGIALWLARGRRRIELRAIALGLIVAGLLVLVVRSLAGSYVVEELTTTSGVQEAAEEAWEIVTRLLADGAWAAIAIGLVALVGVWLSGDGRSGVASRRWLAPVLGRPEMTYGVLALLLLLFVWWEPFPQARRPLYLVVTGILLVIGVELFRRATVREFPTEAAAAPREMVAPLGRLRGGADTGSSQPAQVDELERLAALHEKGVLSDEELAAGKARVLGA